MSSNQHQNLPPHIPPISTTTNQNASLSSSSRQSNVLQPTDTRLQTPVPNLMIRQQNDSMSQNTERHLQHSDNNRQIQSSAQTTYQNSYSSGFSQQGYNTSGQVKPYRPWGAEVAY